MHVREKLSVSFVTQVNLLQANIGPGPFSHSAAGDE
jgi:hypothetical protein